MRLWYYPPQSAVRCAAEAPNEVPKHCAKRNNIPKMWVTVGYCGITLSKRMFYIANEHLQVEHQFYLSENEL